MTGATGFVGAEVLEQALVNAADALPELHELEPEAVLLPQ